MSSSFPRHVAPRTLWWPEQKLHCSCLHKNISSVDNGSLKLSLYDMSFSCLVGWSYRCEIFVPGLKRASSWFCQSEKVNLGFRNPKPILAERDRISQWNLNLPEFWYVKLYRCFGFSIASRGGRTHSLWKNCPVSLRKWCFRLYCRQINLQCDCQNRKVI